MEIKRVYNTKPGAGAGNGSSSEEEA